LIRWIEETIKQKKGGPSASELVYVRASTVGYLKTGGMEVRKRDMGMVVVLLNCTILCVLVERSMDNELTRRRDAGLNKTTVFFLALVPFGNKGMCGVVCLISPTNKEIDENVPGLLCCCGCVGEREQTQTEQQGGIEWENELQSAIFEFCHWS